MRTRFVGTRLLVVAAMVALGGGVAAAPLSSPVASAAGSASIGSNVVKVPVFSPTLTDVGQVNLGALAASDAARTAAARRAAASRSAAASPAGYREVDNAVITHATKGTASGAPSPGPTALTTTNVAGEVGFSALGGVQQAATAGGVDLEPPDQGLCAGGGYVMEFINNALAVYNKSGTQLMAPIGSAQAFLQPLSDFFSDPRCYYDAPTRRWFYQEFVVGTTTSTQYEAVSNTPDPTGSYTVWSIDTTDASTMGCPCFGDYDNFGADANGIYIATDEFSISPTGPFNGVIIYAISKGLLENFAATGIPPTVFAYRLTADPFGQPYIVAPSSTPPGGKFAPNTEYFVESNGDAPTGNHLMVYALSNTSVLATPAPPNLYRTEVATEPYAAPADAKQRPGPRPLGAAYQAPAGGIQADFDAEMEPTYVGGQIYAQLDTGTASGSNAVDWFILQPTLSGSTLAVSVAHQGVVAVSNVSLLYPYTAVDANGLGYLLFSLSGPNNYPSPGYISYNVDGPTGSVMEATTGAAPDDGFTCYAAFVGPTYGGCRWGDYSMGVFSNGRVYMAAEMIPQGYRDTLTNWGTYIWSAPPPAPIP